MIRNEHGEFKWTTLWFRIGWWIWKDKNGNKKGNYDTEKPLKCDWCVDGFAYVSQINNHKRRHIGEKPFKCDFCDKTFSVKQSLPCYEDIHYWNPFKCDFCDKAFSSKSNFSSHIKTHTGENPFKCNFCTKAFSLKKCLTI